VATYTRADLRNKVLGRLGLYDPHTPPAAEDAETVEAEIQQKLEELAGDGFIPFDLDSDAIPAPYMIPLSFIVAIELVSDYGAQGRVQSIALGAERGMRRLARLKAEPYFGQPTRATYY